MPGRKLVITATQCLVGTQDGSQVLLQERKDATGYELALLIPGEGVHTVLMDLPGLALLGGWIQQKVYRGPT